MEKYTKSNGKERAKTICDIGNGVCGGIHKANKEHFFVALAEANKKYKKKENKMMFLFMLWEYANLCFVAFVVVVAWADDITILFAPALKIFANKWQDN